VEKGYIQYHSGSDGSEGLESWRFIDLGRAEPLMAQTFYEAVAVAVDRGLAPSTLLFVQPSKPYVCLGFHQQMEKELDTEYCRNHNLLIIRRSQGGGATYLNSDQLFYQVVAADLSNAIPKNVEALFEKALEAPIQTYRRLGVEASFKPLNDVMAGSRKISGNGAGKLGNTTILVGNIIMDLDYEAMAAVLRVPDEKFRDKMAKSMREWVTSLKRELGHTPPIDVVKKILRASFEETLGIALNTSQPTEAEVEIWEKETKPKHLSQEWLLMPELRHKELAEERAVKVADGVKIIEVTHKAQKLVRITAETIGDRILSIMISGDFFIVPEDTVPKLEAALRGAALNRSELETIVRDFVVENRVQMAGLEPGELVSAIMRLGEHTEKYPPDAYPFAEPGARASGNRGRHRSTN